MAPTRNHKGFTPIELLFVIVLMGILALVAVSFLNTSRERARDAKRLVDVRRIQTALEFYELEHSSYPVIEQPIVLGSAAHAKLCDQESGGFVTAQTPCVTEFMILPSDPNGDKVYRYIGTEQSYTVGFETETQTDLGQAGTYYAHPETINTSPALD